MRARGVPVCTSSGRSAPGAREVYRGATSAGQHAGTGKRVTVIRGKRQIPILADIRGADAARGLGTRRADGRADLKKMRYFKGNAESVEKQVF